MSTLSLVRTVSKARRLRNEISGNVDGIFPVDLRPLSKRLEQGSGITNIPLIDQIIGQLSGLINWGWEGAKFLWKGVEFLFAVGGSLGEWWGILTQASVNLLFFDWNQSDEQIDRQIQNLFNSSANSLGEFVGFTVCGAVNIGASSLIPKIGPAVAKLSATEFSQEAWDELRSAVQQIGRNMLQVGALWLYKNARAWLKSLEEFFPEPLKSGLKSWGNGKAPWTIYGAIEKQIEGIPNETLRNFAEGALEGCIEGYLQAGFITGGNIDLVIEQARQNQKEQGSGLQTIEVNLAKGAPSSSGSALSNRILIQAQPEDIEHEVTSALATGQTLGLNTVGLLVGEPAEDRVTNLTMLRRLEILCFKGVSEPPWQVNNRRAGQVSITIPNPKRGLRWQEIKTASRQWTWGRFKAQALLDSGRKLEVFGATAETAENKAREFLTLSSDTIVAINVVEEVARHPELKKSPTQAFPARGTLLVKRPTNTLQGRIDIQGRRWTEEPQPFELWTSFEPPNMPVLL